MSVNGPKTMPEIDQIAQDGDIRFVPTKDNLTSFSAAAHISRYQWLKDYLHEDLLCLDMGCGSGYGAALIVPFVKQVDAVDMSKNAIDYATEVFRKSNLRFFQADLTSTLSLSSSFDMIISFDVIEHIQDNKSFLENVFRNLNEDGTFICGTPNRLQTLNWNKDWNPFHIREFDPTEFKDLLNDYFEDVHISGQDIRDPRQKAALQKKLKGKIKFPDRIIMSVKMRHNKLLGKRDIYREVLSEDIIIGSDPLESFGLIAVCRLASTGETAI